MMDNVNKNPEDEAENNEVESPVDGPTPDWMRLATSAGGSGSSLTEENTPAWLKSIRSGQGSASGKKQPEPPQPAAIQPAASADKGMSDLERLLAEEGIDLGSVAEERPEGSGGMSARDWLISTSSEEIIRNKLGTQPQAEEPAPPPAPPSAQAGDEGMSDWERLLAEEGIDLGSVAEERPEGSGAMSARDWLIATSSEEIIRNKLAAQPQPEPEPAPTPASPSFSDDKMVVESDLPDWLQEIADDVAEAEATEAAWPISKPEPPLPAPVAAKEDDMLVVEEELPDWLQEIAEDNIPITIPPTEEASPTPVPSDNLVVEEDLPDWLQDIAAEPDLTAEPETQPEPDFTAPSLPQSLAEDKMIVAGDLPDWLREVANEPEPPQESETVAPIPPTLSDDKMVVDEDLPDWLREVESGSTEDVILTQAGFEAVAPEPDELETDEDLPDWLREVEVSHLEDNLTLPPLNPSPICQPRNPRLLPPH
ncbi:MAG: hypothetical protein HC875_17810 [Anaerolineales bacterium]|nr:hypothetical protein [Anaerolineales bacterium]